MCHYLGGGLHGRKKRVKAQSESSKSVVNSVLISREMPVFPGFLEIIRVVIEKKYAYIGGGAGGNKKVVKNFQSIYKDVYRYYGVTKEDKVSKSERYKDVVRTLSQ